MTFTASESKYFGIVFVKKAEDEGASSEGFSTIAFPAEIAPISGSKESPA